MNTEGQKEKEFPQKEKTVPSQPEKSPLEKRSERLGQIDKELGNFNHHSNSPEEIQNIEEQRKAKYQSKLEELEKGLRVELSQESTDIIHKNMVNDVIENAQKENERFDQLTIEKLILENQDNRDFLKKISPTNYEKIDNKTFREALDDLLSKDIGVSEADKLRLFRKTLEYYSKKRSEKLPLWHCTSSYSFRKALREGFSGGHGRFAGEAGATNQEGEETQKGLSVTHPDKHISTESFQQLFARLSSKKENLAGFLKIDSEKLTGKSIAEVFADEFVKSTSANELKQELAGRLNIKPEEITEEIIEQAIKSFIDEFNAKEYSPNIAKIKQEVLPNISDEKLRKQLEYEAENSFPCFITFEAEGEENNLTTLSRGENPTHIPFEDMYWGKLDKKRIKEIRVPDSQISKVMECLKEEDLEGVELVPIEIFEIKRLIESKIKS